MQVGGELAEPGQIPIIAELRSRSGTQPQRDVLEQRTAQTIEVVFDAASTTQTFTGQAIQRSHHPPGPLGRETHVMDGCTQLPSIVPVPCRDRCEEDRSLVFLFQSDEPSGMQRGPTFEDPIRSHSIIPPIEVERAVDRIDADAIGVRPIQVVRALRPRFAVQDPLGAQTISPRISSDRQWCIKNALPMNGELHALAIKPFLQFPSFGIEDRSSADHLIEDPAQVLPALSLEHLAHIPRLRMLELPYIEVVIQASLHHLITEVSVEVVEDQRAFRIHHAAIVGGGEVG